jgi:glycosyltransferase involved in cell wall biosynthesis
VDTLLSAATMMRRQDAWILLVGDGPLRRQVEAGIREAGLQGRVRILGFRSHAEIPTILRHADLFCLPSRYEEVSSALLEAMRAGLPIVATGVGGISEALGGAGRLVAAEDPRSLAQAVDELLTDRALASRLGRRARERARSYEWSELAARLLEVYRAVLDPREVASRLEIAAGGATEPGPSVAPFHR